MFLEYLFQSLKRGRKIISWGALIPSFIANLQSQSNPNKQHHQGFILINSKLQKTWFNFPSSKVQTTPQKNNKNVRIFLGFPRKFIKNKSNIVIQITKGVQGWMLLEWNKCWPWYMPYDLLKHPPFLRSNHYLFFLDINCFINVYYISNSLSLDILILGILLPEHVPSELLQETAFFTTHNSRGHQHFVFQEVKGEWKMGFYGQS